MTTPAIAASGLRKSFGDQVVLDGIDLRVTAGTIFALLGPNGAGKTTAVRILSTLIRADGGRASVAGHDVAAEPDGVRTAIGVTGQFSAVGNLVLGQGEPVTGRGGFDDVVVELGSRTGSQHVQRLGGVFRSLVRPEPFDQASSPPRRGLVISRPR